MENLETLNEYLEKHQLTRELASLGITQDQRQSIRFRGSNHNCEFDLWSFTWTGHIPDRAAPLLKPYCALKWIVTETPPASTERNDAWTLISQTMEGTAKELWPRLSGVLAEAGPTPEEINLRNEQFWSVQSALLDRRTQDLALCRIAFRDSQSEMKRRVPFRSQKTIEECLADAEDSKVLIRQSLASQAGKAARTDALQKEIEAIVSRKPEIGQRKLLTELRKLADEGHPVILDVYQQSDLRDGEHARIHFDTRGKRKCAPVSGLKDRLSRAKKKIHSR